MRIGLSTSVVQRGRSGIGQYVMALTHALLPEAGRHQFTLFVLENDLPLFAFAAPAMSIVSVPEKFRPPVSDIYWHQTQLPRLIQHHRLDVMHVPSYRRLLWKQPCALVATIHDVAAFSVANKYDPLRMFYGRVVAARLARRQHAIIATSHNTARDLENYFRLPAGRVTVIHNGVNHERFRSGSHDRARAIVAQRYGVKKPFFLYVSRLEHPAKNHVRLLDAFDRFKAATGSHWQLVLGGGDWHGAEVIHQRVHSSPFAAEIRCLGFVADEELPDLYRAAEVFVYPSLFEGFGLPPLEAMACGVPVLCSLRGSLPEVVGSAAATVDPEDLAALQTQLARLAADGRLRERLRTEGQIRARQFNWQKTSAATMTVYMRAAAMIKQKPERCVTNPAAFSGQNVTSEPECR